MPAHAVPCPHMSPSRRPRDDRLALVAERDRAALLDLADQRMADLDAAVEDADADAGAGRAAERPLARDAPGQRTSSRARLDGVGRKAPGGQFLALGSWAAAVTA